MRETQEVPFDELPDGPQAPEITPREYSRLKGFEHIQGQIKRFEPVVERGIPTHWGEVNEEGKIVNTHLVIDQTMLYRLKHMLYGVYESDLSKKPVTRDIALDILTADKPAPMGKHQFSKLWETE